MLLSSDVFIVLGERVVLAPDRINQMARSGRDLLDGSIDPHKHTHTHTHTHKTKTKLKQNKTITTRSRKKIRIKNDVDG